MKMRLEFTTQEIQKLVFKGLGLDPSFENKCELAWNYGDDGPWLEIFTNYMEDHNGNSIFSGGRT